VNATEHLIFYRQYIRELPRSLIMAFKAADKDAQHELYELYKLSLDKNVLNIHLALNGEATLILKPDGIITTANGGVKLVTRGGSVLKGRLEDFGNTPEEIANNLRDWMLLTINKRFIIKDVEVLAGHVNTKAAEEILSELRPIDALLLGFGILPNDTTRRLFLPRFIPLFSYDGRPVHVLQFTQPDAGKTEYAVRLEAVFNFRHFTEFPSAAKLIADARTGSLGAVFTSKGITIDEFDKVNKQRFEAVYDVFLTGLEQGVWRRGSQTVKMQSLEGNANIPFIFFGNTTNEAVNTFEFAENTRHEVENIINVRLDFNIRPFLHRLAIVDVVNEYIPISRYLNTDENGVVGVYPDSVIRGIVALIQRRIKTKYLDENAFVQGRLRRNAEAVYNITNALLNEDFDEDVISQIVAGELSVKALFKTDEGAQTRAKSGGIEETEIDMTKFIGGGKA